jgi:L-aminopeptidase/D-esterase-like protein
VELPAGVRIGHHTDAVGRTGCTVLLTEEGATAGVDVRGGAPGTRETDLLRPENLVEEVHAVLLTGGSAFGLDATAGVMRFLEERGVGFALGPARVPIVPAAVIFDLAVGDPKARPRPDHAYAACLAADRAPAEGAVGAGTGATVAKGGDLTEVRAGGLGIATERAGAAMVTAVMVVNAVGAIYDDAAHEWLAPMTRWDRSQGLFAGASTTIGAVVTDALLTKTQAKRVASAAQDGLARAIRPSHTAYDGDTVFCLSVGGSSRVRAHVDAVEAAAADAVARAIARGVRLANEIGR